MRVKGYLLQIVIFSLLGFLVTQYVVFIEMSEVRHAWISQHSPASI